VIHGGVFCALLDFTIPNSLFTIPPQAAGGDFCVLDFTIPNSSFQIQLFYYAKKRPNPLFELNIRLYFVLYIIFNLFYMNEAVDLSIVITSAYAGCVRAFILTSSAHEHIPQHKT